MYHQFLIIFHYLFPSEKKGKVHAMNTFFREISPITGTEYIIFLHIRVCIWEEFDWNHVHNKYVLSFFTTNPFEFAKLFWRPLVSILNTVFLFSILPLAYYWWTHFPDLHGNPLKRVKRPPSPNSPVQIRERVYQ